MQLAIASGGKVVVTGTAVDKERLKLAAEFGAHAVINVTEADAAAKAAAITREAGFDVAFECAGAAPSADGSYCSTSEANGGACRALYHMRRSIGLSTPPAWQISFTNYLPNASCIGTA
jgi:threonine dehydrogenase-like Zn-dependent dehydrogenase